MSRSATSSLVTALIFGLTGPALVGCGSGESAPIAADAPPPPASVAKAPPARPGAKVFKGAGKKGGPE